MRCVRESLRAKCLAGEAALGQVSSSDVSCPERDPWAVFRDYRLSGQQTQYQLTGWHRGVWCGECESRLAAKREGKEPEGGHGKRTHCSQYM